MKKVLYIAFYFNHQNEIASKRLQGIAKYLSEFGYEPIVIVPKTENKAVEIDNVRIVESEYESMISKFLPKRSIGNTNENIIASNQPTILTRMISLAGELFAYPDGMKNWRKPAFEKSCEIIESEDISGIISSSFPITSHLIAYDLVEKYDIPWIADLRDLWNLNPYVHHNPIRNYFEKRLEIKTFKKADILTTTTDMAAETLKTLHPKAKIIPIVSGFDEDDFKDIKQIQKSDKLTLMYAGSLYKGKRDPSILFESVSDLIHEGKINPEMIEINFYGDSTNLEELREKYSLKNIVNICGKVSHGEVLQNQMNSDVLVLISWMSKDEEMFIPGKVYEYMASKKPVLSIGYEKGSLKELIEKTNIGYHISDVGECKKAIYDYYTKYINNELKYCGNQFADEYSMRKTGKKFAQSLEEIQ